MKKKLKVLLISMPDQIWLFNWLGYFIPNLGLASLAGNANRKYCDIKLMDLVFKPKNVKKTVTNAIRESKPDLVGITAMSFQFESAVKISSLIKSIDPSIKVVIGGYHATLNSQEIIGSPDAKALDFIIRGEGEATFAELVEALAFDSKLFNAIEGLCFRMNGGFHINPDRGLLPMDSIRFADRAARLFPYKRGGINPFVDVVETSRGCTMMCNFCSIREMYGKSFRVFEIERVIEDLKAIKHLGGKRVLMVDDNITLDVERFEKLCHAIAEAGLNDIRYAAQVSSAGIGSSENLVKVMREANFTSVFIGIENISSERLKAMQKGDIVHLSIKALEYLNKYKIGIIGGFITGLPDDKKEDIRNIFHFCVRHQVDIPTIQCVTPYPKTGQREILMEQGLVLNAYDFKKYNGFEINVRTKYMTKRQMTWERNKGYFLFLIRIFLLRKNKNVKFSHYSQKDFKIPVIIAFYSIVLFFLLLTNKWSSVSHCRFESFPEKFLNGFRSTLRKILPFRKRDPFPVQEAVKLSKNKI